ncbi:MAG: DUF1080 domain-containing protein [Kiritimatiellaeota bacterium]|nr:DUF1080 domain-containing protein [Kiritimatiellota bacterium]
MSKTPFVVIVCAAALCAGLAWSAEEPQARAPVASGSAGAAVQDRFLLFDGKTLSGWREVDFSRHGQVRIKAGGVLELGAGAAMTGVVYTHPLPRMNYELTLEVRRTQGSDFFCGLTFPVLTNSCTLILGGWGGGVTGLSSIDHQDASDNETSTLREYAQNQWYAVRVRVTPGRIEAWLDGQSIVDVKTEGRRLGMRMGEIELCVPLGVATWETTGELRNFRLRKMD